MADDALITGLIHHPYRAPSDWEVIPVGVHKASTVFFPTVAALREREWIDKSGYTYGLKGTPTTFTLEARLATLEGASHLLLTPSGLASIALINQSLLAAGDEVLLPDNVYGPSLNLARHELRQWGITHRLYDAMDVAHLEATLTPATKLVWLEAAGSVTMEFPDLRAQIRCIRRVAPQALIAIDHTWGAGLAFKPFDLGEADEALAVDLTAHALTKYPSGGGDVLLGSVGCRNRALHDQLAWTHARLGLGIGVDDAAAVLRGLPSIALRYAAQDQAARRIASWLRGQPGVTQVLHPALVGSPGHEHWAALCTQAAGIFSIELDARHPRAQTDAFVDALRLFRIGWSWAGPVSLVAPYEPAQLRRLPTPYRGTLVRLCIGLEDVDDLIADLAQALAVLPPLPAA
ncbi:MAG: PLP-dependent transferase [Leptothrix sp. (in: b-proteobacteria)]